MIRHLRGIWDNPRDPAADKRGNLVEYPTCFGETDHADVNDLVP
jgi:hypothetical protein